MILKTYEYPQDHDLVSASNVKELAVHLSPGSWVRHKYYLHSFGLLIANGNDFITVLWSVTPHGLPGMSNANAAKQYW